MKIKNLYLQYYDKVFANDLDLKDFFIGNKILVFSRLKLVSIGLVLIYGYYLYCDFILFNGITDPTFTYTLAGIHLFGFLLSICFLCIYPKFRDNQRFIYSKWSTFIINSYITLYVLMGAAASLNSQRLTGNIDAYIIILISVAVLFPIRPNHFLTIVFSNHIVFLMLLTSFSQNAFSLVSKQINTTATVLISCLISFTLFVYKKEDHINKLKLNESITELKRIQNELKIKASLDPLTGVYNRRYGIEVLQDALLRANLEQIEFTLCFIDINNLKVVNDKFGHPEGDYLIQTICNVIRNVVNEEDVLFRYGGDEFIVIFFSKTPLHVEKTWERILTLLEQLSHTTDKQYPFSASHGLFYFKSGMEMSFDDILENADKEMYKEKYLFNVK
ncbi:GGDEF domain-containing protein [Bacillus sp. REN16]|uniref:GGDEF domain-containing protein n=1 Tax=Bacillus sp. REN16 TaxID=2887296 RepID=UPI001E2F43F0|nr:GGDEF domain-containing protein [Bacillus sp. REN16]MCC3357357.1 GGDEF domain-containing protein [Bacillus sp. REN16]